MCFSPAKAALPCRGRPCGCTLCGRVLVYSYLPKQLWPVGDHPAGVLCAVGCVLTATCQSSSGLWGTTLWVYTVRLGAVRNHEYAHSSCAPMCISLVFSSTASHKHGKETCMEQHGASRKWCRASLIPGFFPKRFDSVTVSRVPLLAK